MERRPVHTLEEVVVQEEEVLAMVLVPEVLERLDKDTLVEQVMELQVVGPVAEAAVPDLQVILAQSLLRKTLVALESAHLYLELGLSMLAAAVPDRSPQ